MSDRSVTCCCTRRMVDGSVHRPSAEGGSAERARACRASRWRLRSSLGRRCFRRRVARARVRASAAAAQRERRGSAIPTSSISTPTRSIYDKDHNIVTATGDVVLYYKDRVLQADQVVYDRAAKRVLAEGQAKLTDEHGNVTYTPKFDLTDDFASGFADSVQSSTPTRRASPRRASSAPTARHGARPGRLYRLRALQGPSGMAAAVAGARRRRSSRTSRPTPSISRTPGSTSSACRSPTCPISRRPIPTVTRQSGVLAPDLHRATSDLGLGRRRPLFLRARAQLRPDADAELLHRAGPGARRRCGASALENGEYNMRLSGIDQMQPVDVPARRPTAPATAGSAARRESRASSISTTNWTIGWDLTLLTRPLLPQRLPAADARPDAVLSSRTSSPASICAARTGAASSTLSGYRFQPTTAYLDQRQEPTRRPDVRLSPHLRARSRPWDGIGGEVDGRAQRGQRQPRARRSISRSARSSSTRPTTSTASATNLHAGQPRTPSNCLLRGIAGDYARATAQVSWQSKIRRSDRRSLDSRSCSRALSGEATEPQHGDIFSYGELHRAQRSIPNYAQPAFFNGQSSGSAATGMPGVGLEYRYPFVVQFGDRPAGHRADRADHRAPERGRAQAAAQRGRAEPGVRRHQPVRVEQIFRLRPRRGRHAANYGLQYTDNFADGGHAQLRRRPVDPARRPEFLHDRRRRQHRPRIRASTRQYSNYVAGETLQPFSAPLSFTSKQQFDSSTFALARFDGIVGGQVGGWTASRRLCAATPRSRCSAGHYPRQGFSANANYKVDQRLHGRAAA